MAANAESGRRLYPPYRIVKSAAMGHERGRGHDATRMRLDDGAIYSRRKAKIIGIDDQAPHRVSLAGASPAGHRESARELNSGKRCGMRPLNSSPEGAAPVVMAVG